MLMAGARLPRGRRRTGRGRDPRGDRRQPVPLHRLHQDRRGDRAGGGRAPRDPTTRRPGHEPDPDRIAVPTNGNGTPTRSPAGPPRSTTPRPRRLGRGTPAAVHARSSSRSGSGSSPPDPAGRSSPARRCGGAAGRSTRCPIEPPVTSPRELAEAYAILAAGAAPDRSPVAPT